jgi:hypothetical protein
MALLVALALQAAPSATLVPSPAAAKTGEPVEFLLDVVHPAGARVRFPEKQAESRAWVLLGERTATRAPDPADPALEHTVARWTAMALEAGESAPPPLELEIVEGATVTKLAVEALPVQVLGALAEGEDAPRPLLGWRAVPADLEPARPALWIALAIALGAIASAFWLLFLRRKRPAPARVPTPLERLDELAARFASDPESARDRVYDLVHLVRDSVDGFLHEHRAASTDEAWSAAVAGDERVPVGVRNACARLVARSERIKYAAETPTRFAVEEDLKDARAALEALAEAHRVREGKAA